MNETAPGTLIVAAMPIGCPDDASPRLAAALANAAVIAAEDTRRVRRLGALLGIRLGARIVSYYDSAERRRVERLVADLRAGRDVLLVTDAGMPGLSDPGYRLVNAAATAGIRVTPLPGPSALTAALAVAGLPSDRFCFEGFPARRAGERTRRFAELAGERRTMVFFEAPRRLAATLAEMAKAFGEHRPAVACRELTKTHEEVRRGTLGELAEWAAAGVLGEVTVVVAGRPSRDRDQAGAARAAGEAAQEVARRQAAGLSARDAISEVAADLGLPRRVVYAAATAKPGTQRPPGTQGPQAR